ncbi:MAG TPA: hypothetical protein PK012_33875, partial [Blastocatellia bacterium]|nr:hypothetical protein [Blastocatellia bacterium]
MAKYNTTSRVWGALADAGGGNGVNGTVVALAVMAGNLYVGGDFTVVGDNKPSLSIGRYAALEITAVADLTRVAGGLGSNSPIATVGQSGSAFAVSINGGASATVNGVTVSGLSINAAGQVTANIVAAANATSANFTLRVSDCAGLFSEATLTITVVKFSGTVTDPLVCTGPGNTVAVTLVLGNSGATPLNVGDKTTFTNLVGMPGTCTVTPNVGTCTVTNANLTYSATLAANQTVMLNYLTQVADNVAPGAQVCTNNVATFGTNSGTISSGGITFDDSGPISLQVCGTVNCPAAGPGLPVSAASPVNDQKAGSVLVYNVYTSASDPTRQNTRIALTNTHPTRSTAVHLFFVDGTSCSVADANVCLTANQTTIFQASDLDPGTTGYIVAVAVGADGCPINFNYLIGDEYVKFAGGHAANLGAEAIAALAGGLPSCNANSVTAQLNFDGVSYNQVPRALALDNVPSRADGNDTMLILNRFGGNLGIGAGTLINLFGIFYDDSEKSVSFGFGGSSSSPGTCQFRSSLSNAFPRVTPRFETFISAGRSGWARIYSQSDIGLLGAVLNFNPNAGTNGGAFTGGHNLHKLTLTSAMSLTI